EIGVWRKLAGVAARQVDRIVTCNRPYPTDVWLAGGIRAIHWDVQAEVLFDSRQLQHYTARRFSHRQMRQADTIHPRFEEQAEIAVGLVGRNEPSGQLAKIFVADGFRGVPFEH